MNVKVLKGGVHLPYYKELTKEEPITLASLPQEVIIPLQQHAGAPCQPLVTVGEKVLAGQKIGEAESFVSAPVHASVSGRVKAIELRPFFTGGAINSIVIEVDEIQDSVDFGPQRDPEKVEKEEILKAVKAAGIVGMGGATFPTAVKLAPPKDKVVDTILINGCECEPFLTCDHRLMLERADELIAGAKLIFKASGAKKCYFCVEDNKEDAIELLNKKLEGPDFGVIPLPTKFPQGSEKHLINAALGREIPSGGLPFDVGALVLNIATTFAIYEAVILNKPLMERIVTVTGQNINKPANLLVKIGTPIQHLIDECNGIIEEPAKILMGGPMTGFAQKDLQVSVIKGTNGLVALPRELAEDDEGHLPCVRCGRCVDACPMLLYPNYLSNSIEKGDYKEAEKWDVLDCVQCGICTYVCIARRPTVQLIKKAKSEIIASRQKK